MTTFLPGFAAFGGGPFGTVVLESSPGVSGDALAGGAFPGGGPLGGGPFGGPLGGPPLGGGPFGNALEVGKAFGGGPGGGDDMLKLPIRFGILQYASATVHFTRVLKLTSPS
uniref:Uncharacterized protein n=1 Tax=Chromera velia CCMP2878 TaxID=1169474 RepID=A0A0G4HTH5_9ALVE|eukprot:Cvel_8417.t1-p1 / transcript=Cvel_8417.t1 / gene=Cvel_8417 / organism=Chromera_velia_CCMP2878 / gene_product=hypothetical protein / transcript_product=hypothetical protein / location=Cvel_scaffold464:85793-86125(-) / protein_length=111 / sequence_SO=supercontig / SO=protein_coding / is_pseudo=false